MPALSVGRVSLDVAADLVAGCVAPPRGVRSVERVGLWEAGGRVLAEDARAAWDLPRFARSLVDGWAVRAAETAGRLRVAGEVRMGLAAPPLPPGAAIAVPTGGMLPSGADAVLMQEHASSGGGWVSALRPVVAGSNVIAAGADARAGAVTIPVGRRLRPPEVAMLATSGHASVPVWERPRIALLSTGDELDKAGEGGAPGRVPDANGPALAAALRRDGGEPVWAGLVADDPARLRAAVTDALRWGALVCSGGSSVGERDYVRAVLEEELGPPLFSGIAVRPGGPTAVYASGGRWAVALPGHPVSALVVYELVVRRGVLRYGGEDPPAPRGCVQAELAQDVSAPADRELVVRVRLEGGLATPLSGASAAVAHLASAGGLVRCPAGSTLTAASRVTVVLL